MTYKLSFLSFFLFKKCSIMKNLKGPLFIWTLQNIFQNIMIKKKNVSIKTTNTIINLFKFKNRI
jgi:hypothetical protein